MTVIATELFHVALSLGVRLHATFGGRLAVLGGVVEAWLVG